MSSKKITAYKAFNSDWTCLGFQYEIGKEYEIKGEPVMCKRGFHACENIIDTLRYYNIATSVFAEVELSGKIISDKNKSCASKIKIVRQVDFAEIATKQVKGSTSWNYSHSATSGERSPSATSGYSSPSATSGVYSVSATRGGFSPSSTSGVYSPSVTRGGFSPSATSGYSSPSATRGGFSASSTSGGYSASATSGYSSPSAALGSDSHSSTSGGYSHSATLGYGSRSSTSGENSISVSLGAVGMVKAAKGSPVALCHYRSGKPVKIVSGVIGKRGLKPDTWYKLDENGRFVEA